MMNIKVYGASLLFLILLGCQATSTDDAEKNQSDNQSNDPENIATEVNSEAAVEKDNTYVSIEQTVQEILDHDVTGLAQHIAFPLKRAAPLPPIRNLNELTVSFDVLFDETLLNKLRDFLENPTYIDSRNTNGTIGIMDGELWFNESGTDLISLNYSSEEEKANRLKLEEKVKNSMHPAVRKYDYNTFIGKTDLYLFRIDETENGLRYTQWRSNQTMASEPDFMLFHGESEQMGTAGGYQTTFKNKDQFYILDEVWMSEDDEGLGTFLIIQHNEETIYKGRVEEILDPFEVLP